MQPSETPTIRPQAKANNRLAQKYKSHPRYEALEYIGANFYRLIDISRVLNVRTEDYLTQMQTRQELFSLGMNWKASFEGMRYDFFDDDDSSTTDRIESEADQFAFNHLVPEELWDKCLFRFALYEEAV